MSLPTTRAEFIEHCKRRLGHPVIKINVTEEQLDDRVDEALTYYWDYHFSGSEKQYYKYQITANNKADAVYSCNVVSGGTGYANSDTVVFSGGGGNNAAASITTDNDGVITSCLVSNNGSSYATAPTVSITTSTGSGANITCELGGWIPMPENIIGAVRIFPLADSLSSNQSLFNIRYQIALNDLYTLTSSSMVPYYSAFQHIRLIEQILVGEKFIRYNRHRNRLYADMDWDLVNVGDYMLVEAYSVVDPTEFPDVWKDRWLIRYCTALIKRQWGFNLSKFTGMMLPGDVQFNGERYIQEAVAEIDLLEEQMITTYSIPVLDSIG